MASTGETWRLGRRPALDGLRGVAVAFVVVSHTGAPWMRAAGHVGVTVFFTLSGFLIATLLFEEHDRTGRIDLTAFYQRRARRLLPALFAVVVACSSFAVATGLPWVTRREVLGALTYSGNIVALFGPVGGFGMLHHTWSLVIEEQFYVVWPAVMLLMWRRRTALLALLVVGAATSLALRVELWDGGAGTDRILFGTDTRVDGILLGCALAVALRPRIIPVSCRPLTWVALALIFLLAGCGSQVIVWGLTLAAVGTVVLIVGALSGAEPQWLSGTPLVWLGRRSYGLYLWHHPVTIVLGVAGVSWPVHALVMVPVALLLTVMSWRYIESPWLQRRSAVHHDQAEQCGDAVGGTRLRLDHLSGQQVTSRETAQS